MATSIIVHYFPILRIISVITISLIGIYLASHLVETNRSSRKPLKITGLVLARCGSKGIKMKNIADLNGKPLLQRTLNAMTTFGRFENIWVSTDCKEVADVAVSSGALVYNRSLESATDHAESIDAVKEFIASKSDVGAIALVQCTSPFIRPEWLEEAYEGIVSGGYDSMFSVTRSHKLAWKILHDGSVEPDNFDPTKRPRRQDWEGQLLENGMFYFAKKDVIKEHNLLQGGRIGFVEVPLNHSLEIDTELDLDTARFLLPLLFPDVPILSPSGRAN